MYLLVCKTGKYFRFDYRFVGKRKTLALGVYPDVSLKKAREQRDEARELLAGGVLPFQERSPKPYRRIWRLIVLKPWPLNDTRNSSPLGH